MKRIYMSLFLVTAVFTNFCIADAIIGKELQQALAQNNKKFHVVVHLKGEVNAKALKKKLGKKKQ